MALVRTLAAAALVMATSAASAADLPRGYARDHAAADGLAVEQATPVYRMPGRWIDPIHVGATLPREIPLRPMPARYGIIGYGYAFVNGQPLLIDRDTREIVLLLADQ